MDEGTKQTENKRSETALAKALKIASDEYAAEIDGDISKGLEFLKRERNPLIKTLLHLRIDQDRTEKDLLEFQTWTATTFLSLFRRLGSKSSSNSTRAAVRREAEKQIGAYIRHIQRREDDSKRKWILGKFPVKDEVKKNERR